MVVCAVCSYAVTNISLLDIIERMFYNITKEVRAVEQRIYGAIDLKSFYASVECVERGLDPMTTNLVVADASRTEKTICLAVSPSLKALGIPGRPRLFEVVEQVGQNNALRRQRGKPAGKSWDAIALKKDPALQVDYIVAPPQMAKYMQYSARIYEVYLKYVAPEDIHVYSIDEVFIDVTPYLRAAGLDAQGFVRRIIKDVFETTGITATAGLGTNLYLCKVAMDIVAKKAQPDQYGVRLAYLDEKAYRQLLWDHRPITDFWRVGKGIAKRLEGIGLYTMGDIARCSLGKPSEYYNADLLYKIFGINAELLIDHAWGWESCTIAHIKAYRPQSSSLSSGQVLHCPYDWEKARLIVREMADLLALELVDKNLVTDQVVLTVGYDIENLADPHCRYSGQVVTDHYGRRIPKHAHGTENLMGLMSSAKHITQAFMTLYDRIVDKGLLIRRLNLVANHILPDTGQIQCTQLDLFTDRIAQTAQIEREKRQQQAVIGIKRKYGKNAILKGMNYMEGATARDRNRQIGGHKA